MNLQKEQLNRSALSKSIIDFSVNNVKVTTSDISMDMIKEDFRKDEKGNLCYKITNDLYIPFDETELTKFVNYTQKVFTIRADIKYRLYKDMVGAGIQRP